MNEMRSLLASHPRGIVFLLTIQRCRNRDFFCRFINQLDNLPFERTHSCKSLNKHLLTACYSCGRNLSVLYYSIFHTHTGTGKEFLFDGVIDGGAEGIKFPQRISFHRT